MKPKTSQPVDLAQSQGFDQCQTPPYALDPLLPYLKKGWTIWECAAGEGYLVQALKKNGFTVAYTDILTGSNFFDYQSDIGYDCIATHPPYSIKYEWLARCYKLGKPFALLLPLESLAAWKGQQHFRKYGIELLIPNKCIHFKMPNKGWKVSSAQFPTAWFTWGLEIGRDITFVDIVPRAIGQAMLW